MMSERLLLRVKMLRCRSKKGVAFRQRRAHSGLTAVKYFNLCKPFLPWPQSGKMFNPRATGGFL
jgi:hypothetical protein